MKQYKYLMFDLDGTITDSCEGIQKCFNYALLKLGNAVSDHTKLRVIGPPIRDSLMNQFGYSKKDADLGLKYYRERFEVKGMLEENKLYDGIYDLLSDLKKAGYILICGSSKPENYCQKIFKYFKIDKFFDHIGGASFDSSRDTKDAVIRYVIKEMNITDKSQVVLIGDTKFDLMGADDVGIDAIAVSYGYGPYEELLQYNSVYIAKSVADLRNYLL